MSEPACTHLGAVVVRKLPFAVEGPLIRSLEPGED